MAIERNGAATLRGNPVTLLGPELKVGDPAPDFTVVDVNLKPVKLADTGEGVRIFSVVPSLDTPVCAIQTQRFNKEAPALDGISVYTISMDLPFAMKRWSDSEGTEHVHMLSDHRDASFGASYGTLVKDVRIESRAIFVVGPDNKIDYVEYVKEVAEEPNYEKALTAAKQLAS